MVNTEYWLLALIPLLPAVGALIGVLGARLPDRVVHVIGCGTIGVAFFISLLAFKTILVNGEPHGEETLYPELYFRAYEWFGAGSLHVDIAFFLDPLSAVMCLVVTGVGFLIHVYSVGYMHGDRSYWRYFAYLNLFCFAMLVLVLADNLVLLFVGWEGVGLASYLLIGFWYEDEAKATAGKKAFIVNRIGDFAVLLGLVLLFAFTGTFEIPVIREWVAGLSGGDLEYFAPFATLICILFFIGCTGKSAQIPLFVWLPDAMAGPTPVSALIHAATMVTAGVYLVARMGFLYSLSEVALMVVAIIGALTAFIAATIGIAQNDIKKVLAYSTVSQLGFMFLAAGVGAYGVAIFHLVTHAFFKGLLFLGSGAVIHALHGEQDIRKMGGLWRKLPVTHWTFLIGCLAISGVPILAGFFSKDEILWYALASGVGPGWIHSLLWLMGVTTAAITAFYMFRLYFLTFRGEYRGDHHVIEHVHAPGPAMEIPLIILAGLAVVGGWIGLPHLWGLPNALHGWLHQVVTTPEARLGHGAEWLAMLTSVGVAAAGIGAAWYLYVKRTELPERIRTRLAPVHRLIENKYYVDEIYDRIIVKPLGRTATVLYDAVDRIVIDTVLVGGVAALARMGGSLVRLFQNGDVQRYAFFVLFGLSLTLLLVSAG